MHIANLVTVLLTYFTQTCLCDGIHSLFISNLKQYGHITYTHKLLLNRPAQIACFLMNDSSTTAQSVFYWTHRGLNISQATSPFIAAEWGTDGTIIISSILPRQISLWCQHNSTATSELFIHRINFVETAYTQTVFSVDMSAIFTTDNSKAFQEFLFSQQSNCRVQLKGGGLGVLRGASGVNLSRAVPQKAIVMDAVWEVCQKSYDCVGVSLDFFDCSVSMAEKNAAYSLDFSTMHFSYAGPIDAEHSRWALENVCLGWRLYVNFTN